MLQPRIVDQAVPLSRWHPAQGERNMAVMPVSELLRMGTARPIIRWGTPVLHTPARPVTDFGSDLQDLLADMFATNTAANGAGLAAQQIGVDLAVFKIGRAHV